MGSTSKPLGGITTLKLRVASSSEAAPTLPIEGVKIPLLEDLSTYTQRVELQGSAKNVEHTIAFYTSAEYQLPEELEEGLFQGFIAEIELRSTDQILVGWSTEALYDRALRLVSCTTYSFEKPSSRARKEWLLKTTDSHTTI